MMKALDETDLETIIEQLVAFAFFGSLTKIDTFRSFGIYPVSYIKLHISVIFSKPVLSKAFSTSVVISSFPLAFPIFVSLMTDIEGSPVLKAEVDKVIKEMNTGKQ